MSQRALMPLLGERQHCQSAVRDWDWNHLTINCSQSQRSHKANRAVWQRAVNRGLKMCCFQGGWMKKHIRSRLPSERWGFSLNRKKQKKLDDRHWWERSNSGQRSTWMEWYGAKGKNGKRKMQYCESQVTLFTKCRCLVEWVEKYLAGRETSPNFPTTTTCKFNNWIFQFEGCFCSGQNFFFSKYMYIIFFLLQMKHTTVCKVISAGFFFLSIFFFFCHFAVSWGIRVQRTAGRVRSQKLLVHTSDQCSRQVFSSLDDWWGESFQWWTTERHHFSL